jgi:Tfp pilus assembly protein PilN
MRAVNLLPVAPARTGGARSNRLAMAGALLAAGLVFAGLAFAYMSARTHVDQRTTALAKLDARVLAAAPAPVVTSSGEQQLASEQVPRVTALNAALAGRVAWDQALRQLALVLPDDVWLSTLTANRPAPVVPPTSSASSSTPTTPAPAAPSATSCGTSGFCLTGYAYSQPGVARLLARLATMPAFSSVTLVSSVRTKLAAHAVYEFTIQTDLAGQG